MLHTRGLPSSEAHELERACEDLWRREISTSGLRLLHVSGGLELDAPGRHKGIAAKELIGRSPFKTFAVHVGDDESDEDAFKEVSGAGFGIRVGAPDLPSHARGRLSSWLDLPLFLKEWLAIVENRDVPLGMTA
jgi:trehalose-6-phosphatase